MLKNAFIQTFALALLLAGLITVTAHPASAAPPYQAQAATAELGRVKVLLSGPKTFVRIDGLDRNIDDILLATQSPAAAVLAIYAEPQAWKEFSSSPGGAAERPGLNCHAIISTPAPMADRTVKAEEFDQLKKDLSRNLKSVIGQKRRLDSELAGVSDHQVESAQGLMEAFEVLEEKPTFLTYRLITSLELKLKKTKQPRRSRTVTISSTMSLNGKIINLQLVADEPQKLAPAALEETARNWRDEFQRKNQDGK